MGPSAILRPVDRDAASAYSVPFTLDRRASPLFHLHNRGREPVYGVTLTLLGSGLISPTGPSALEPGERLLFRVHAADPECTTVAVVRWFRPDGCEYLWRISF